jgi:flagellar hook assembly protein FlgD
LPTSEFVTLKIYNMAGQEVATLLADNLEAGDYNFTWDSQAVAGGVYFYKLQAGTFQQVRKMMLIK